MLIHQKYAWGAQFLEEMNKPAEREKETRIEWKNIDYGGRVSSKKHLRVSQCQEGARTIFYVNHNLCILHDWHHSMHSWTYCSPFVNQEKVRMVAEHPLELQRKAPRSLRSWVRFRAVDLGRAFGTQTAGLVKNCCKQDSVPSTLCPRDVSTKERWRRSEKSFKL